MRVLHVVPSFYPARVYGGPTESVYNLCRATAQAGCEVRVLTTNANGPDAVLPVPDSEEIAIDERLSVRYCRRLFPESVSWTFLRRLPALMRWAEVVHLEAVYSFPTIPTLALARRLGKPLVWTPRGSLARWRGARRQGLKNIYDQVCGACRGRKLRFHFTSDEERDGSLPRFPGADGAVIPNGVAVMPPGAREPRDGKLRLLYLGRFDPIKGIENLLEACALLKDRRVADWELTLAGAGEKAYTEKLRGQIRALGLDGRVRMPGRVEGAGKEAVFARADMVVVPSHSENFCIVAAEALARGVPVIVSRGAPWSRLESRGCGLWVSNEPPSLAEAIEKMSRQPLERMGEKGRAWMKAEFSWDRVAGQMIELYREMRGLS